VAVDEVDVTRMAITGITTLMASRSERERRLTLVKSVDTLEDDTIGAKRRY